MLIGSMTNAATSRRFTPLLDAAHCRRVERRGDLGAVRQQAAGRQPKLPTYQPITKSMYVLPRESVRRLPFVAATCSSVGRSLASGSPGSASHEGSFFFWAGA